MAKQRILIIEDSVSMANHIAENLMNTAYEVDIKHSAKAGLLALDNQSYALLLLDLILPDMHGKHILNIVREKYNTAELPVIVISALNKPASIKECLEAGANDFMAKPLELWILEAKIRNLVQLQQTNSKLKQSKHDLQLEKNKLLTILDNLEDVVAIQKPDHTIVFYNQKGYSLLNSKPGELEGKKCFRLLGRSEICPECPTCKALISKQPETVEKYVPELKQWVHASSIPLLDEKGEVKLIVEKIQDISSQKHLMQEMEAKNLELDQLNTTKDKLFSIIGHDLKNPINSLLNFAEILGNRLETAPRHKLHTYHQAITESAEAVNRLLNNLLQWSRAQQQQIKPDIRKIDLYAMVVENIELMKTHAQLKNIKIVNKVPQPLYALADWEMIHTVMRNLVSNAVKYSPLEGNVYISGKNGGNKVILEVTDTGVGMSESQLNSLFTIKNAISKPGTAGERGTGLGLVLSKEFAEQNRGKLLAFNNSNKGSKFVLELPAFITM